MRRIHERNFPPVSRGIVVFECRLPGIDGLTVVASVRASDDALDELKPVLFRRNDQALKGLEVRTDLIVVSLQLFVGHFIRITIDVREIARTGSRTEQHHRKQQ